MNASNDLAEWIARELNYASFRDDLTIRTPEIWYNHIRLEVDGNTFEITVTEVKEDT